MDTPIPLMQVAIGQLIKKLWKGLRRYQKFWTKKRKSRSHSTTTLIFQTHYFKYGRALNLLIRTVRRTEWRSLEVLFTVPEHIECGEVSIFTKYIRHDKSKSSKLLCRSGFIISGQLGYINQIPFHVITPFRLNNTTT